MKCLLFTSTLSFLVISALASPTSDGRRLRTLTTNSDVDDLRGLHGVDFRQTTEATLNISTEKQKPLQFSERTDRFVKLSNNFRTARRIKPEYYYEGGTVITNRTLDNGEMFEVVLEKLNSIWTGSIKVGVIRHSSDNYNFPNDCYNSKCGVTAYWDLDSERKVGDRIGVMKHENGTMDVFINGEFHRSYKDVPETVYGYVDIYGRAEQASILLDGEVVPSVSSLPEFPNHPILWFLVELYQVFSRCF